MLPIAVNIAAGKPDTRDKLTELPKRLTYLSPERIPFMA